MDWQEIVKEELLKPFPQGQGPFAHSVVLRLEGAADLTGVFHHGICDGMSGVYVMRDILRLLSEPDNVLPAIPGQLSLSCLIPTSARESPQVQRKIRGFLIRIRLRLLLRRVRAMWFSAPIQNPAEGLPASLRMYILTESLTVDQTAALVVRCKAERTSVHAALCVTWLRAWTIQLERRKSWARSASSPISLRERLGIPDTSGLYLANAVTRVNCIPRRDFWQAAREFKRKLKQASNNENLFLYPLMLGAVFFSTPQERLEKHPADFIQPVGAI